MYIIPAFPKHCAALVSHIKKSLVASEQDKPHVRKVREEWLEARQPFMQRMPEQIVFIDETCVKTNLTRLRARAAKGKRAYDKAPFGRWHTQTFIAGLTQNA